MSNFESSSEERANSIISELGEMRRKFKKEDPIGYVRHMLKEAQIKNPKNSSLYQLRAQRHLSQMYKETLRKGIKTF